MLLGGPDSRETSEFFLEAMGAKVMMSPGRLQTAFHLSRPSTDWTQAEVADPALYVARTVAYSTQLLETTKDIKSR